MKKNMKLSMVIAAFAITLMLTLGIGWAQQQQASIVNEKMDEYSGYGEVYFDGEEPPEYCPMAQGAQFVLDGIASGEFTFTELQDYFDSIAGSSDIENQQISFDAMPSQPNSQIPTEDILPVSIRKETIDDEVIITIQPIDVVEVLFERLQDAEPIYCDDPEGDHPDDWRFHPEAICLFYAMIPLVGEALASGAVSAFFSLFGPRAWATGMSAWIALLRGVGIYDAQILENAENRYQTCMGIIG